MSRVVWLLVALVVASVSTGGSALDSNDGVVVLPPVEMKCGDCPCGNPCGAIPPPPPPSPPPPSLPPPESPSVQNCPPPPSFIVVGPTENLYPMDPQYLPSGGHRSPVDWLPAMVVCVLLGFWEFRWL